MKRRFEPVLFELWIIKGYPWIQDPKPVGPGSDQDGPGRTGKIQKSRTGPEPTNFLNLGPNQTARYMDPRFEDKHESCCMIEAWLKLKIPNWARNDFFPGFDWFQADRFQNE